MLCFSHSPGGSELFNYRLTDRAAYEARPVSQTLANQSTKETELNAADVPFPVGDVETIDAVSERTRKDQTIQSLSALYL